MAAIQEIHFYMVSVLWWVTGDNIIFRQLTVTFNMLIDHGVLWHLIIYIKDGDLSFHSKWVLWNFSSLLWNFSKKLTCCEMKVSH